MEPAEKILEVSEGIENKSEYEKRAEDYMQEVSGGSPETNLILGEGPGKCGQCGSSGRSSTSSSCGGTRTEDLEYESN